jgi:hypothetical protein
MASLKERLSDKCACGHTGSEHNALDRGSHIALEACTVTGCTCPQFLRLSGGNPRSRAGKSNLRAHGRYSKRTFRI